MKAGLEQLGGQLFATIETAESVLEKANRTGDIFTAARLDDIIESLQKMPGWLGFAILVDRTFTRKK